MPNRLLDAAPRCIALVPAAGSGQRFGQVTPKQYLPLLNAPLIIHTLKVLCQSPQIDAVWLALSPEDEWWENVSNEAFPKLKLVKTGGQTRAQTVLQTLAAMQKSVDAEDWILVHDAARPCLSLNLLTRFIDALYEDPIGGILAIPVADTLKRADQNERIVKTVLREQLWQAQTPQMFRYGQLFTALKKEPNVTDEASAIEALGLSPKLVRSESSNLKVTFPADFALAELILQAQQKE